MSSKNMYAITALAFGINGLCLAVLDCHLDSPVLSGFGGADYVGEAPWAQA